MSRVPDEIRTWSCKAEETAMELRRQIQEVKAKVEEHRAVMQLAGLTRTASSDEPESMG